MSFLGRLASPKRGNDQYSAKASMSIDDWWAEFGPTSTSSGGMSVTQITALQVSTVQACVTIRSEDVAKLPVHVYRKRADGGREIVTDHPVERVLCRPNSYQSRFEFIEQMQVALMLRGNAYAVILRDGRGRPTDLIPISPDRVWIFEAPGGMVFYQVARRGAHETAVLGNEPLMIPSDDILHLRWMALDNSLYGASRIGLAREAIGLALSQQELAGRLSANSTNLGGVLTTEQKLSAEAAARLSKSWKEQKSGLRNAGDTAVLEQGLKWSPIGMTARDAEMIAARNFQVQDIARLFRMPIHKLGVMDKGIGSSLEQMDQDYMNSVVSSDLGRWESKLDQVFGLHEEGLFVEFDVSGFLRASLSARYASYRTGIVGMFLTPNEARRAEGLPDHPEGDTLYQPTNVAPIGFEPTGKESGPGSDVTGAAAAGGRGDPAAVATDVASED
jgi:HK97 family phage portal protein